MKNKKSGKQLLVSALAVGTAAVMLLGGGTYAYLQGTTDDVENNFNSNQVLVDLDETTGNDYEIIPGTSQDKDPTVTVNNTVDAYVYVKISDATDGLVSYDIADGWTLLDGFDNVYYREVAKDAVDKVFPVLKNDTVSYDAALENSDMVDADGNLKTNLTLSFKAYAIQKEPFNNPVAACPLAAAATAADIEAAINAGKSIELTADVTLNSQIDVTGDIVISGNGNTLTAPAGGTRILNVNDNAEKISVTLDNVKLDAPNAERGISFYANNGLDLNITNSEINADKYAINIASENQDVNINVKDSTVEGWCAFQTWSAGTVVTFDNCTLRGVNDKAYNADGWNNFSTIIINENATDTTLTFNNCRLEAIEVTEGNIQSLLSVRATGANITFNGCTFSKDGVEISASDLANDTTVAYAYPGANPIVTVDGVSITLAV